MKSPLPTFAFSALLCTACAFAAAPAGESGTNHFKKKSGAWEKASNWDLGRVPAAGEPAIVYDASVSISSKIPSVSTLNVGGVQEATLTLQDGGVLDISGKCFIGRKRQNTKAVFLMEGGQMRTNPTGDNEASKLYIGESATHSSSLGWAKISGGTFTGGLWVGSNLPNTGVGTLSIVGSAPSVSGKTSLDSVTCNYGTVEFVLDEKGVATLNYSEGNARFSAGSNIRVDGTNYAGKTATISLMRFRRLMDNQAKISCEGFPGNYKAQCVFEKNALVLKIKQN